MLRRLPVALSVSAGIGLLVVSLVGANAALQPTPSELSSTSAGPATAPVVVCSGMVDTINGLVPIFPVLSMPVTGVCVKELFVSEGQEVAKGTKLLKLDDAVALAQRDEAEAGVEEARAKLRQAEQALDLHPTLLKRQQAAIEAKQSQLAAAEANLNRLKTLDGKNLTNKDELRAGQKAIEALQAGVRAEELALEEIRQRRPTEVVAEAKAAVARYTAKLAQAQAALQQYTLLAPCDGIVVQVLTEVGSPFSAQTRQPAFWFQPKGPLIVRANVDQEFAGRIAVGQPVQLGDDTLPTTAWTGKVSKLGVAYMPRRILPAGDNLSLAETTRTLEVLIEVHPGGPPLRVGQKMRVDIGF